MVFRNAEINDLPTVVAIYNSTIQSRLVTADVMPVTVQSKERWFYEHNQTNRPLWIIENEEKDCIGWASFQDFYGRPAYDGTAEVSIYLHTEMRGKGYGKKILQHCINACGLLKIHTLLGYIFAHNAQSIRLFENEGFTEWGYLKDIAVMDDKYYSLKIFGKKV